jgi:hypothetical protein
MSNQESSVAATSSGSITGPAAVPATTQGPPPRVAAPASEPAPNVPPASSSRKQKNYAPKKAMSDGITSSSGISHLLNAVAEQSFAPDRNLKNPNFVVPCFIMFFQILGIMDTQMARTRRFTDANPDWHPFVSQLYFSVLIYYFVLLCQSTGNQITQEQRLFLEYLESQFNVSHAKIPGPLIPFFQSLAACSGPDPTFGNVAFGIPDSLDASQHQHFLSRLRLNAHLPSIVFILDQFMRLINRFAPVGAAPAAVNLNVTDSHYIDIFGVAAAAGAVNRVCMKTPSARVDINVTHSAMQSFFGTSNIWRSVLPFDPNTNQSTYTFGNNQNVLTFEQYIGFRGYGPTANQHFNWFNEVGRVMQPYADFFRDSASLGSVNTIGIGVVYIRSSYADTPENATSLTTDMATRDVRYQVTGTSRYQVPDLTNLQVQCSHQEEYLESVTEQLGMLTQLHVIWNVNNNANSVFPGPISGNTEIGSVWQRLWLKVSPWLTVQRYVGSLISGYFHTPVANKFGN